MDKHKKDAVDWSKLRFAIANETCPRDGLRKWREELEQIVAPQISKKRTPDIIRFRGKQNYFLHPDMRTRTAANCLQFLYQLEDAIARGDDLDSIIGLAVAVGMSYSAIHQSNVFKSILSGKTAIDAILDNHRTKNMRVLTRKDKTELRDVPNLILETAVNRHRGKRDWLAQTTAEVIRHRGGKKVSTKTVGTELKLRGLHPDQTGNSE